MAALIKRASRYPLAHRGVALVPQVAYLHETAGVLPQSCVWSQKQECRKNHGRLHSSLVHNVSSTSLDDSDGTSLRAEALFLQFFDKIDADKDGRLDREELNAGLDALLSMVPSSYCEVASTLFQALGPDDKGVSRADWINAIRRSAQKTDDCASLRNLNGEDWLEKAGPHLVLALEAVDERRVRRLAKQREFFAKEGGLVGFETPHDDLFESKHVEASNPRKRAKLGLRTMEPCPPGYTFLDVLGGGAFGSVFLVRSEATSDAQAMKRIDRQLMMDRYGLDARQVEQMVEKEFKNLRYTTHPHIVHLFEFRQDSQYSYFIMEAARGGDLLQLVQKRRRLSESYVASIIRQVAYALHFLHTDHQIHKDVKLENIMLLDQSSDAPHAVLIDLGLVESRSFVGGKLPGAGGTPNTMAPEVYDTFLGVRPQSFDERCDIYSLGIVAYELLVGKPPYKVCMSGDSYDLELTRAKMETVDFKAGLQKAGCSLDACDLVTSMVSMSPPTRPTALDCLRHKWLSQHAGYRRRLQLSSNSAKRVETESVLAVGTPLLKFAHRDAQLRSAAYHLVQYIPVRRLRSVIDSFKAMDTDFSGDLSYDEIADFWVDATGVDRAAAHYVASLLDMNNSGIVDFAEFSAACIMLADTREKELHGWVEKVLDDQVGRVNKDGLTVVEMNDVLEQSLGGRMQKGEMREWLDGVSADLDSGSTRMSVEEFRKQFNNLPKF